MCWGLFGVAAAGHGRAGHGRATAGRLQGFVGLFGVAAGLDHSEPGCHLEYARLSPAFAWPLPSSSPAKPSWENFVTLALGVRPGTASIGQRWGLLGCGTSVATSNCRCTHPGIRGELAELFAIVPRPESNVVLQRLRHF